MIRQRWSVFFIIALLIISFTMMLPTPTLGQVFVTNTPASEADSGVETTPIPTSEDADGSSQSGGLFATNTPNVTLTPSPSPTPSATTSNTPLPTNTPTQTPTVTPTPNGPFWYPEGINPLTGLPYPDQEAIARRNLIVKISNFPPIVRPQVGVNSADLVFEYEAEGGVTRFAAIFRSNAPERVGSIRSGRLLDMELVTMYEALLAYSGTSEPIQELFLDAEWKFQLLSPSIGDNCDNAGFCRFPREGLAFEHTLFGDTNKMWEVATRRNVNTGYRALGFAFRETADANGIPANDVFINWFGQTDARWQLDTTTGQYLRYTEGIPHIDAADNSQLFADNLIIIEVPHNRRPDLFPEGANYESLEIALWDQGRAYVVRDGQLYQGFWRRRNQNPGEALQLIYGDNTPIMLKPGRSWVSVVRNLGDAQFMEDQVDMVGTSTAVFLSATPTSTSTPTP